MIDQPDQNRPPSDMAQQDANGSASSSWGTMRRFLDEPSHEDTETAVDIAADDLQPDQFEALTEGATLPVGMFSFLRQAGDRCARLISQNLRQRSGALVDAALVDHVNLRFGSAFSSIPIPSLMALLRSEADKTEILLVIDGAMAALYFDLLLGGSQIKPLNYMTARNFSVIETRLF